MSEILSRARKAARVQGGMTLLAKAGNLLFGIWLARLLHPEDYGYFTIALLVTGLVNALSHFGFQTYIIQLRDEDEQTYALCFTLNMMISAVLAIVIGIAAALWPGLPEVLRWVLGLYAINIVLAAWSYVALAILKRSLDFGATARAEVGGTLVSAGMRVGFAAMGLGALCFPLADLLGSAVRNFIAARYCRWKPSFLLERGERLREVLSFGLPTTFVSIAGYAANQVDKLLVTSLYPLAAIGAYTFGNNNAMLFYNALIVPQTGVFMATFSRLKDDSAALVAAIFSSTRFVFSWSLPFHLFLILQPELLVRAVFTDKWLPAAPILQIFAFDFLFRGCMTGIAGLQLAYGHAQAAARTKWINAGIYVLLLGVAAAFKPPLTMYALAAVIAGLLGSIHNLVVNGRLVGLPFGRFFMNQLPPLLVGIAAGVLLWGLDFLSLPVAPVPRLAAIAAIYAVAYLSLTYLFNRQAFLALRTLRRSKGGVAGGDA